MPENISTYWARNVKLKSRQGDKFDFVLNVKNSDGSDYVFADNTEAFFGVFKRTSNPEGNLLTNDDGLINRNAGDILNWAQKEFGNVALDHSFSKDLFILVIYK